MVGKLGPFVADSHRTGKQRQKTGRGFDPGVGILRGYEGERPVMDKEARMKAKTNVKSGAGYLIDSDG